MNPVDRDSPSTDVPVNLVGGPLDALRSASVTTIGAQRTAAISPQALQPAGDGELAAMTLSDIGQIGEPAYVELRQIQSRFLDRINKADDPQLFRLLGALGESVEKENLPALVDRVLAAEPGAWERVTGFFGRKKRAEMLRAAYEQVVQLVRGTSSRLSTVVTKAEAELQASLASLRTEAQQVEALRGEYRGAFDRFSVESKQANAMVERGRGELAAATAAGREPSHLNMLQDKLQALESRALALEGSLTHLAAESLTLSQLESAGYSTIQEVGTSAGQRFTSIRGTLLALHGTLAVRGTQQLAEQHAALDRNLHAARSKLMQEVVTTAANAPADNRLKQAEQLRQITADIAAVNQIVEQAKARTAEAFSTARASLADTQNQLLKLGAEMRDKPVLKA